MAHETDEKMLNLTYIEEIKISVLSHLFVGLLKQPSNCYLTNEANV